jgi:hypothetical protein
MTRRDVLRLAALTPFAMPLSALANLGPTTRFFGLHVFERIVDKADAHGWRDLSMSELMGNIALEFIDTPYVAYTLELDDHKEIPSCNLEGLDCVTFFESTLDLARMLKLGGSDSRDLLKQIEFTRYRGGRPSDYTSRLHYTTDWFYDNAKKGVIHDLTPELPGAESFTQQVGFMSAHPDSYRLLKANPQLVPKIKAMEDEVNARPKSYLPLEKIAGAQHLFQTGDIVGVCTTHKGIDIGHTGICFRDTAGELHFMDASSLDMRVTLEPRDFSLDFRWSKANTGIILARPLEPQAVQS